MSEILNKTERSIESIIAKIDNDFNPDNSDWIPRVGAWCIDAMSQLNVLKTSRKRRKYAVKDKIVYVGCPFNEDKLKLYDKNGCEIDKVDSKDCVGCIPSTGEFASETSNSDAIDVTNTTSIVNNDNAQPDYVFAETVNGHNPHRYNVNHYKLNGKDIKQNYVIVDNNKLELNFNTDFVYLEDEFIETKFSSTFNCELPVVPNNGILIEALTYYCMFKMLCRGYKHPVFNLNASQYGTNPYYNWVQLKEEAKRNIINNNVDDADTSLFRSNFFIETFDPRP